MYLTEIESPLGQLTLTADNEGLTGLWFVGQKYAPVHPECTFQPDHMIFQQTELWLEAYFARLSLPPLPPLSPYGTAFQQSVWQQLLKIPYGKTTTYGAIAASLRSAGQTASPQAVGGAVGRNPIAILIPCHRVIGADGSLTGYAGGLEIKRQLLSLECHVY